MFLNLLWTSFTIFILSLHLSEMKQSIKWPCPIPSSSIPGGSILLGKANTLYEQLHGLLPLRGGKLIFNKKTKLLAASKN